MKSALKSLYGAKKELGEYWSFLNPPWKSKGGYNADVARQTSVFKTKIFMYLSDASQRVNNVRNELSRGGIKGEFSKNLDILFSRIKEATRFSDINAERTEVDALIALANTISGQLSRESHLLRQTSVEI